MVLHEFDESIALASNHYDGHTYPQNFWLQVAETTTPLTTSKFNSHQIELFQSSIQLRSKQAATKVIVLNFISLFINLVLAIIGFYFSFTNNSTASSAFAADCLLDLISSAILLWRYHGDLNSIYAHAREQIACIYLGVLFEVSAIGIIIKSITDMSQDSSSSENVGSNELVYLSVVATIACSVLTIFKCDLYKTLRDKSILLDVINTLISTVFAISIVVSQALIKVDPRFWFLDPVLSIILGIFMIGFGINVIYQNFDVLKPIRCNLSRVGYLGDRCCNESKSASLIYDNSIKDKNIDKSGLFTASERYQTLPIIMKNGYSNYCTINLT